MKKKALLIFLALCMIVTVLAGCAKPYNYNLSEYIVLGESYDMVLDLSEINEKIEDMYQEAAKAGNKPQTYTEAKDGIVVEMDDTVNISYVGKVDGEEFDGGSTFDKTTQKDKPVDLTIGSGQFIDGFEDGLIGAEPGQKLDIEVTFPEDYGAEGTSQAELNGKKAIFTGTIHSVKRNYYPEYNDENIAKYFAEKGGYKTVKEFEDAVSEDIKKDLLWDMFINGDEDKEYKGCLVKKYPKKELKKYYDLNTDKAVIDNIKATAAYYGMTEENFLSAFYGCTGGWKGYFATAAENAKAIVKRSSPTLSLLVQSTTRRLRSFGRKW